MVVAVDAAIAVDTPAIAASIVIVSQQEEVPDESANSDNAATSLEPSAHKLIQS